MRTQNLHDDFVEQVRSSSDILSVAPFTMKKHLHFL